MRFDVTRILAPTAYKPRTSGPRDGNTGTHSQHIQIAPAIPAESNHITFPKDTPMRTDTQGQVIAALTTKSPMTRAELLHETDLSNDQLSNAIYNLKKRNLITGSNGTYALAVGQTSAPAAKAVKPVAKIPCGPSAPTFASRLAVESVNGADSKDQAPPTLRFDMMDIRPTCTRAIATADGGCIVIDGAMIIAELNKEQREAVAAAA